MLRPRAARSNRPSSRSSIPRGGDGSYSRDDVYSVTQLTLRWGTNLKSGEQLVVIDITIEDDERYSYSLPIASAKEFAETLAAFADEQS